VRHTRVELDGLTGAKGCDLIAKLQQRAPPQHEQPLIPQVAALLDLLQPAPAGQHQLECQHITHVARQRHIDAAAPAKRPGMNAGISDRRRTDKIVQGKPVHRGQGNQHLGRRPALAGLQPRQVLTDNPVRSATRAIVNRRTRRTARSRGPTPCSNATRLSSTAAASQGPR
jgi:hypothetical protein